ncbi:GNAT family N-acetyltransferase [Enterovibrio sp. ZSDZ42]|uniref:GNAT family N-acetyltransferase n=1 Tax=Enterovibrio gelatinilyticus TaxID=2899819 RepID=A0ABT5QYW9_9GAMM|nr:GNAT family N-acetyltransferase [Enterovibrio sp. ZSDZ42]MDD1793207.1 GNAT family N-acetyltransferase [Enterovibrio sp. ZSDZ42]
MEIVEAQLADLSPFFEYLEKQLAENAADKTPLFQPVAKKHSHVTEQLRSKFNDGFSIPFGESGWRKLWLVKDISNNTIHGHIDLRHHSDHYTLHRALLGMGVDSQVRKQGIGRKLIERTVEFCHSHNRIDWLDLQVLSNNTPAIKLYIPKQSGDAGFSEVY